MLHSQQLYNAWKNCVTFIYHVRGVDILYKSDCSNVMFINLSCFLNDNAEESMHI